MGRRRVSCWENDVVRESGVLRERRHGDPLMVDVGRDKHWRENWGEGVERERERERERESGGGIAVTSIYVMINCKLNYARP